MSSSEYRVSQTDLEAFTKSVFEHAGMPSNDAAVEAEVLVWANLRGVDSHGVLRIPAYLANAESGKMNPNPDIQIKNETPATFCIEADRAFGPIVTTRAVRMVIDKAKTAGIGWGLIRNLTHQGAMAYYSSMAAREGMAGIAIVCSPPNTAPFGARARGVHNSPISIAVPAGRHQVLCLDMATSVAAFGKVSVAKDKGIPLPPGWALDEEGNPTTDPDLAKILVPAGGPKGSGLAMMFECLTGLMVDNPLLQPVITGATWEPKQNSLVAAINIANFIELDTYRNHVDNLIDAIKSLPPAEGHKEVFVPGEPESRTLKDRSTNGIPLPPGTVTNLKEVAGKLGIDFPKPV